MSTTQVRAARRCSCRSMGSWRTALLATMIRACTYRGRGILRMTKLMCFGRAGWDLLYKAQEWCWGCGVSFWRKTSEAKTKRGGWLSNRNVSHGFFMYSIEEKTEYSHTRGLFV